jgi:NTE family protein
MTTRPKIALVLSGGAARGAYEAGVIAYLREGLVRDTGVAARFDILCGSSVGAINACFLAANAHRPEAQAELLVQRWASLKIDDVLQLRTADVMKFVRSLLGVAPAPEDAHRRGGAIDPSNMERMVLEGAPWSLISRNLADGHLDALSVSTTHVTSGHTVIFVQRRDGSVPEWSHDPFVHAVAAKIRPQHALASGAIPLMFPPVSIEGQYYCDGGLRQNTPLSPALRLGADRVLVVSLRHLPDAEEARVERDSIISPARVEPLPSPYLLAGKVINALWLDHVDYDLDRMRQTNALIEAGVRAFGPGFVARLNAELLAAGRQPLREIAELRVMPSRDIGAMATEFARTEEFTKRVRGITGTVLRRMAVSDAPDESDLLSYLLFDGAYCQQLIDLGIEDARSQRDALARFFDA